MPTDTKQDPLFDWVPFHEALADALLVYRHDRSALMEKLSEVAAKSGSESLFAYTKTVSTTAGPIPAPDIDPFTVFGIFNRRIRWAARLAIRTTFGEELGVSRPYPANASGIPILHPMQSRFVTKDDEASEEAYERLWEIFETAIKYAENPDENRAAFVDAFDAYVKNHGPWMLTMGLYWFRPNDFINLDGRNRAYLLSHCSEFAPELRLNRNISGDAYLDLIGRVKNWMETSEDAPVDFPRLSLAAWHETAAEEEEEPEPDSASANTESEDHPVTTVETSSAYTVESIVDDGSFVSAERLRSILKVWRRKKNIILQGPPGTGKTWLARRLSMALHGEDNSEALTAVQFHPSMSYEDFVRGWRPSGGPEGGGLILEDGPFLRAAEKAADNDGGLHVVIIEEINRGNPAQIFGEMLTLLEADKRNPEDALRPLYPKDDSDYVVLPENLYVIGTMNLADRSLALVDIALRRRFAFIDLAPSFNDAWLRHCIEHRRDESTMRAIQRWITDTNELIARDINLGHQYVIGHSFLTPSARWNEPSLERTLGWYREVVDTEIRPLLEEYWFDSPDLVSEAMRMLLPDADA